METTAREGHSWLVVVLTGLTVSGFVAAASMVLALVGVWLLADEQAGATKVGIVACGTIMGTCIGSWRLQPAIFRALRTAKRPANADPHS
jgi:hypothetical protein